MPDSSKAFVACPGSNQLASVDLTSGRMLTLLDAGKTPVQLALKPDGGADVESGRLPDRREWLTGLVEDVCYRNAKNYFTFPV